jgi:hypothetical protein
MNQSKGAPPAALVVSRLRCVFPGLHLVRTVITELGHATKARSRGSESCGKSRSSPHNRVRTGFLPHRFGL